MINAILVDDHALFRLGVKSAIISSHADINIIGEADCGSGLFRLLETVTPNIILLDIILPDTTGIEIAEKLRKERPEIKILAISAENTSDVIKKMLHIGIGGFISKRRGGPDEIAEAIRSIMSGLEYYGDDISSIIYKIYISKKNTVEVTTEFTEREKDIIELCRTGLLSKEIALRLNISSRTVDNHKRNIFQKLGINNTVEMVQYAIKNGIISIDS